MTKVLIVGGGIAGTVCAMALQRAGCEAVVYEAGAEGEPPPGAFLTLAVNGLDALRAVGADGPVAAVGFPSRTLEMRSGTGKLLGVLPIGGARPDGPPALTLRWHDLYVALRDEARRRGITVRYGRRLVEAQPRTGGGVSASFADGTQDEGDLLVGADGLHSRVRGLIDASAPEPRFTGLANVWGYARLPGVPGAPGEYVMTFGHRAFFGYVKASGDEVWWFANPQLASALPRAPLGGRSDEAWRAELAAVYGGDAGPAAALIRATDTMGGATNQHDLPHVPVWSRDDMLLIGDAAHAAAPSSGQGASLACEDAVTLARCLRDHATPAAACAAYEALRRRRVERIVAHAARLTYAKAPGPVGRAIRDAVMPVFMRLAARRDSQRWVHAHHVEWDARVAV